MSAAPVYQPRYYESVAVRHVFSTFGGPCFVNVAWGFTGSPATRPELDALMLNGRRAVPVEVKAYQLDEAGAAAVVAKYQHLGFSRLLLVTPAADSAAALLLAHSRALAVELLTFQPPPDAIWDWYDTTWPSLVPAWVNLALATGGHHLRFVLTRPTGSGRFVVGQQRSRIYDVTTLRRAVFQLPHPPARLLWSPQRFSIPRDLIARRARVTPLGGFVGVDIDGDRLHRARYACQLGEDKSCGFCLSWAMAEYERLRGLLPDVPCVDVVASGGRGLHVYYADDGGVRGQIIALAQTRQVRVDQNVSASPKHLLALPGSFHAGPARPVASLGMPGRHSAPGEVRQCS